MDDRNECKDQDAERCAPVNATAVCIGLTAAGSDYQYSRAEASLILVFYNGLVDGGMDRPLAEQVTFRWMGTRRYSDYEQASV